MKTILLTGWTDYITPELVEKLSGRFTVVITSDDTTRTFSSGKIHNTSPGKDGFDELFQAYDFSAVWYFAPSIGGDSSGNDFSQLQKTCDHCRDKSVERLIVVSSSMVSESVRMEEEKVLFVSRDEKMQTRTVMIRVPYLIDGENSNNQLGRLFSDLYNKKRRIQISRTEEDTYEFFPLAALINLMSRITLSLRRGGSYVLPGEYIITEKQLEEEIHSVRPGCRVILGGRKLYYMKPEGIKALSEMYNFVTRDQKRLDFSGLYGSYVQAEKKKGKGGIFALFKKIRGHIPSKLLVILDVVVLFLAAEYISRYTSGSVYFKAVDVRLIFILLIATFHGLVPGVIAALCECVVLYFQYHQLGISSMQLFYNVENWIPFVLYIVFGAITGFFSDLRENERAVVDRENKLLREKYLFLNDIYSSTLEVKDAYRYQILGFDESYGKIGDAVVRMNCDTVSEALNQISEILSELLDNSSVTIYRSEEGNQLHIFPCNGSAQTGGRILSFSDLDEAAAGMTEGRVWKNLYFIPDLPIYTCILPRDPNRKGAEEAPSYLVAIWDVIPEQLNDFYVNRFEILCRLAGQAVERAELIETMG